MNSRESASDLLRKALYALEASGHGGDPRCDARGDAEDGNIDGNHSFSDTAGASTSASTDYRGWPMPEASPVSRYTVTPTSLPIASATTGHYLPRASVAGVRSAPAQLIVYGQQRPPGNAYLEQKRLFSGTSLSRTAGSRTCTSAGGYVPSVAATYNPDHYAASRRGTKGKGSAKMIAKTLCGRKILWSCERWMQQKYQVTRR